jgi:hypothetical protein
MAASNGHVYPPEKWSDVGNKTERKENAENNAVHSSFCSI